MGNFIDKTFTVIADILLKVLPASKKEKEAFSYYTGRFTQALEFYHQALGLNPNLPQALHNIGVIYHMQATRAESFSEDEYFDLAEKLFDKAAEYWRQALKLAPKFMIIFKNSIKIGIQCLILRHLKFLIVSI